jgi:VNT family MFS transporter (synaptic vesicle glycoprotein 2)
MTLGLTRKRIMDISKTCQPIPQHSDNSSYEIGMGTIPSKTTVTGLFVVGETTTTTGTTTTPIPASVTGYDALALDDIGQIDQDQDAEGLDEFLEGAYQATRGTTSSIMPSSCQWRYWSMMLALGVANSSDATEILCISYILSDHDFKEHMLYDGHGGLLAAAVFLGMLLGGLIVGTMGDWIGRRPMLLLGLICNSVAGFLSALAPNVWALSILRFCAGAGIGATVPPLFTLVTELAPPSIRGFCVTLCASFWMVGSMYVALLALWFFEGMGLTWRIFALACALPSAFGAVLVYSIVPESPRFLGLEQRSQEGVNVANLLAMRMGYYGNPITVDALERTFPPSAVQDLEHRQLRNNSGNQGIWEFICMAQRDFFHSTSKLYSPTILQTTWPLQMVWFSLSFGSYGLLTWINTIFEEVHLENVYFNALLFSASNLPGNILTAVFMDRMGRSSMLVASVISASLSLVLFAACAYLHVPSGIVLSACMFQCFTIAAWNAIDTMTSELFPTLVRSTGMGICAASGRMGAICAQFVNGALIAYPVRLLLVASTTLMLGAFTPCWLPSDMTGQPVHDDMRGKQDGRNSRTSHTPLDGKSHHRSTVSYSDDPAHGNRQQQPLHQKERESGII